MGVRFEPNIGLSCATCARLKRLKASATKSKRLDSPNEMYFSTRRSIVTMAGVCSEFVRRAGGLDERGNAPARLESRPVDGFTVRPLATVNIGATSGRLRLRTSQFKDGFSLGSDSMQARSRALVSKSDAATAAPWVVACRITDSATLPSRRRSDPLCPWERLFFSRPRFLHSTFRLLVQTMNAFNISLQWRTALVQENGARLLPRITSRVSPRGRIRCRSSRLYSARSLLGFSGRASPQKAVCALAVDYGACLIGKTRMTDDVAGYVRVPKYRFALRIRT